MDSLISRSQHRATDLLKRIITESRETKKFDLVTGYTSTVFLLKTIVNYSEFNNASVRLLVGLGGVPGKIATTKYEPEWKIISNDIDRQYVGSIISSGQLTGHFALLKRLEVGTLRVWQQANLHAKLYLSDEMAWIGSANFSHSGLQLQYEALAQEAKYLNVNNMPQSEINPGYTLIKELIDEYILNSTDVTKEVLKLLEESLYLATAEEAIAKALEGFLDEHPSNSEVNLGRLLPFQKRALNKILTILATHNGAVLAYPTGSGKTIIGAAALKLATAAAEASSGLMISKCVLCPPLVKTKWDDEYKRYTNPHDYCSFIAISMLNSAKADWPVGGDQQFCLIDEAHNFNSYGSKRSIALSEHPSEYYILVTATPISRRVTDLARIVELLDPDNLTREDYEIYKDLFTMLRKSIPWDDVQIEKAQKLVQPFIVRETKGKLRAEMLARKEEYQNRCFPDQKHEDYELRCSFEDNEKLRTIVELSGKLNGALQWRSLFDDRNIMFRRSLKEDPRLANQYMKMYQGIAKYNILHCLSHSNLELIYHVNGMTQDAFRELRSGLEVPSDELLKNRSRIQLHIDWSATTGPESLKDERWKEYLGTETDMVAMAKNDSDIYRSILDIAKTISKYYEKERVRWINSILSGHASALVFCSKPLSLWLYYAIFRQTSPNTETEICLAGTKPKERLNFIEKFKNKNTAIGLGFCTEILSEGVDLDGSNVLINLDTPTVLRRIEQRVGRIDRLTSPFDMIHCFWPKLPKEIPLGSAHKHLVQAYKVCKKVLGSNFSPSFGIDRDEAEEIQIALGQEEDEFETTESPAELVKKLMGAKDDEKLSRMPKDAFSDFQEIYDSIDHPIVESTKARQKGVHVCVLPSDFEFGFFAFRRGDNMPPRMVMIKDRKIILSFPQLTLEIRSILSNPSASKRPRLRDNLEWQKLFQQKVEHYKSLLKTQGLWRHSQAIQNAVDYLRRVCQERQIKRTKGTFQRDISFTDDLARRLLEDFANGEASFRSEIGKKFLVAYRLAKKEELLKPFFKKCRHLHALPGRERKLEQRPYFDWLDQTLRELNIQNIPSKKIEDETLWERECVIIVGVKTIPEMDIMSD